MWGITAPLLSAIISRYPSSRRMLMIIGLIVCGTSLFFSSFANSVRVLVSLPSFCFQSESVCVWTWSSHQIQSVFWSLLVSRCRVWSRWISCILSCSQSNTIKSTLRSSIIRDWCSQSYQLSYLPEWFLERRGLANGILFAGQSIRSYPLPLSTVFFFLIYSFLFVLSSSRRAIRHWTWRIGFPCDRRCFNQSFRNQTQSSDSGESHFPSIHNQLVAQNLSLSLSLWYYFVGTINEPRNGSLPTLNPTKSLLDLTRNTNTIIKFRRLKKNQFWTISNLNTTVWNCQKIRALSQMAFGSLFNLKHHSSHWLLSSRIISS